MPDSLKLAVFGQAPFGREVTARLAEAGHEIVAVYAPPARPGGRADPLAQEAEQRGWRLYRHARFRRKGEAIPELVDEYRELGAELNVLPFTTVILPSEIVDAPRHGSLCFHPSKLPAYRGGSAIPWQIIQGETETAATVFRPDDGVDTGPVLVQKTGIPIDPTDTAASLYFDKLYPAGVEAMLEAVQLVASGRADARFRVQPEAGASHQPLLVDEHARIDWQRPAAELERLARGCDPNPGAWAESDAGRVRGFGCRLDARAPDGDAGSIAAIDGDGVSVAAKDGMLRFAKLRIGDGAKAPAAEAAAAAGLAVGARLR